MLLREPLKGFLDEKTRDPLQRGRRGIRLNEQKLSAFIGGLARELTPAKNPSQKKSRKQGGESAAAKVHATDMFSGLGDHLNLQVSNEKGYVMLGGGAREGK